MYVLEIETKDKLKNVSNPRKARIQDRVFCDVLQVMDGKGRWRTICRCTVGVMKGMRIVEEINSAIRKKKKSIYVDI